MTTTVHQSCRACTPQHAKYCSCTSLNYMLQLSKSQHIQLGVHSHTHTHQWIHGKEYTHFLTFQGWFVCSQAFVEYISALCRALTRMHRKLMDRWDKSASFTTASPPSHTQTHTYICNWLSHISHTVNHSTLRLGVSGSALQRFPWNTRTQSWSRRPALRPGDRGIVVSYK